MAGCLRMAYDKELYNVDVWNAIDKILKIIHIDGHTDEYDCDLNGLHAEQLINSFKDIQKALNVNDRKRSADAQITGKCDYKIIPINSFEEAQQYKKYTNPDQPWCITNQREAFNTYISDGKRFYFCLKNGFENIPKDDTDAPLNEYGLSMIAVNVNKNGDLDRVTTRYNHVYGGENNPGLETTEQLERVLNVKFYDTFKPYTKDELHRNGYIFFDEVQGLLDKDTPLNKIFDDYINIFDDLNISERINIKGIAVYLHNKANYITLGVHKKLILDQWVDDILGGSEVLYTNHTFGGFVRIKNKFKIINNNGQYMSNIQFDFVNNLYEKCGLPFYLVQLNKKYNLINYFHREFIFDQWVDKKDLTIEDKIYNTNEVPKHIYEIKVNNKLFLAKSDGNLILDNEIIEYTDFYRNYSVAIIQIKLGNDKIIYYDIRSDKFCSEEYIKKLKNRCF